MYQRLPNINDYARMKAIAAISGGIGAIGDVDPGGFGIDLGSGGGSSASRSNGWGSLFQNIAAGFARVGQQVLLNNNAVRGQYVYTGPNGQQVVYTQPGGNSANVFGASQTTAGVGVGTAGIGTFGLLLVGGVVLFMVLKK